MSSIKTTELEGDVSIGRHVGIGGNVNVQGNTLIKKNLRVEGWLDAKNIKAPGKGVFTTIESLKEAYPDGTLPEGCWAIVGGTLPGELWYINGGVWVDSGKTAGNFTADVAEVQSQADACIAEIQKSVDHIQSLVNALPVTQETGDSTTSVMSQKATTDAIAAYASDATDTNHHVVSNSKALNMYIQSLYIPDLTETDLAKYTYVRIVDRHIASSATGYKDSNDNFYTSSDVTVDANSAVWPTSDLVKVTKEALTSGTLVSDTATTLYYKTSELTTELTTTDSTTWTDSSSNSYTDKTKIFSANNKYYLVDGLTSYTADSLYIDDSGTEYVADVVTAATVNGAASTDLYYTGNTSALTSATQYTYQTGIELGTNNANYPKSYLHTFTSFNERVNVHEEGLIVTTDNAYIEPCWKNIKQDEDTDGYIVVNATLNETVLYENSISKISYDNYLRIGKEQNFNLNKEPRKFNNIRVDNFIPGALYHLKVKFPQEVTKKEYVAFSSDGGINGTGNVNDDLLFSIPAGNKIIDAWFTYKESYAKTYKAGAYFKIWGYTDTSYNNIKVSLSLVGSLSFSSGELLGATTISSDFRTGYSLYGNSLLTYKGLIGCVSKNDLLPHVIKSEGEHVTYKGYYHAKIFLKKGEKIVCVAWYPQPFYSIMLLTDEHETFYDVIFNMTYDTNSKGIKTHTYIATDDCYIIVNLCSDYLNTASIYILNDTTPVLKRDFNSLRKPKGTIYIAAVNSCPDDKFMADYVCTGEHDEKTIQDIIDNNIKLKDSPLHDLIFLDGDYYIDGFTNTNAITLSFGSSWNMGVSLRFKGYSPAMSLNDGYSRGAVFHVTKNAYDSITDDGTYDVIKIFADGWDDKVIIEDITIKIYWNQKKIIGIDAGGFNGAIQIKNTQLYAFDNYEGYGKITVGNPPAPAAEGCIGIRMCYGSSPNGTYGNNYENTTTSGFYEGFAVCGEHVFMYMCAAIFCVYGYTFQKYGVGGMGNNEHPSILIRCVDERNVNMPAFYQTRDGGQYVEIIAFSFEHIDPASTPGHKLGDKAKVYGGQWGGHITYTLGGAGYYGVSNTVEKAFWEYGHGKEFETRNMMQRQYCTTTERQKWSPNYLQRVFDTTLNKLLMCVDTGKSPSIKIEVTSIASKTGTARLSIGTNSWSLTISSSELAAKNVNDLATALVELLRKQKVDSVAVNNIITLGDIYNRAVTDSDVVFDTNDTGITSNITIVDSGKNAIWTDMAGNIV